MPRSKKWSTGQIGNGYPDHSERGNPNTRGLSLEGIPGVEGYIEEDRVLASEDNRPLENLAQNDQVLEQNLTSVASEVDYGVLRNKDEEFRVEVLQKGLYPNPDDETDIIETTPLRIHSGQAIVDGQVISVGNQKIIYFLKDDGSYIFPDYTEHEGKTVIPYIDANYAGSYQPVYDTVTDDLPENFTNYEIKIINKYTVGDDKLTFFKVYRDWEDIIPYTPDSTETTTNLNFIYDENYGRESEGVWLSGDDIDNIKISNVVVTKDITVTDKLLNNFHDTGTEYEQQLITDGIFFDNIPWKTETQEKKEVQDIYVDSIGNKYFLYKHEEAGEDLFYLPNGSEQVLNIGLINTLEQTVERILYINGLLYILGSDGYFATYDVITNPSNVQTYTFFSSNTENFKYVTYWQNEVWIATDKNIYHIDADSVAPGATFDVIDFATEIDTISGNTGVVDSINILEKVYGNFFVDSSLKTDVQNLIKNPSFERGGIGTTPNNWSATGTFEINPANAYIGEYKALINAGVEASQVVETTPLLNDEFILSAYFKSVNSATGIKLKIEELDISDAVIGTYIETFDLVGGDDWTRFDTGTYTITNSITTSIKVYITNDSAEIVQVDAIQFEKSAEVSQFVQGYEYLFIGFTKHVADKLNPPFAFIDSNRLGQINYSSNTYGNINTINDATQLSNNEMYFVDNTNVYSCTILNDEDEYDRVSIKNVTDTPELNLNGKVDKLTTIEAFDNRVFFGGVILNKSISFTVADLEADSIQIIDIHDSSLTLDPSVIYNNMTDLLGEGKLIPAHDDIGMKIEFPRVEELYEAQDENAIVGAYLPNSVYSLAIKIDDAAPIIISVDMPDLFEGPISIEDLYNLIMLAFPIQDVIGFNLDYSNSKVDGLYSIGKNKITRHVRGNIQRIFKQDDIDLAEHYNKGIYVILEDAILKSKYDPNIKKTDNGIYIETPGSIAGIVDYMEQLPVTSTFNDVYHVKDFGYYRWDGSAWVNTGAIHQWDLDATEHSIRKFKNIYNQSATFSDSSLNKTWVDLTITGGSKLVPGSVRVKTNIETEIGFSENEDFFVDYENGRIIRSTMVNYLQDSGFEYAGTTSTEWAVYASEAGATTNLVRKDDSYKSFNGDTKILDIYGSIYVETSSNVEGIVYQYVEPASLSDGDTYTFSIKLKTNKPKEGRIRLSECTTSVPDLTTSNDNSFIDYTIGSTGDALNEWHTYSVSHTITDTASQYIRVEIVLDVDAGIQEQLFVKEAQLERNQVATPYVSEFNNSRIDPGLTVYVDFTEKCDLTSGVDYTFDAANKKVIYHGTLDNDTELYLDYKYKKIFNPFLFATSIPKFDVSYNDNDDYFLFLYSGRIWAINFVLSLLSQDEENPLLISYDYHYPRIDKLKIRNNSDQYGNFIYLVKGTPDNVNPYGPYDRGIERISHTIEVSRDNIEDTESNDMIYEMNVIDYDYNNNDIYDRRIFVDSADHRYFNISLYDQTVGYFPYTKDFISTSGMNPLNRLNNSKIVDIIKNFNIKQLEEVGAWGIDYQLALRNKVEYPSTGLALFVDVEEGLDTNVGTLFEPLKTIQYALNLIEAGADPYIIIRSEGLITEDIEIDIAVSEVRIFAQTYARWRGNIQNKTNVLFQGFQFERHNFYVINEIDFYYCTFINSTVNNYVPTKIHFTNCKVDGGTNTFLYVKNTIFPSPFVHPYQRNINADDGVAGTPESVATSDEESIHPGIDTYQQNVAGNPSGSYKFYRCLVVDLGDNFVKYELEDDEPWISNFLFERSTIANNKNLFITNKPAQTINYDECIIYNNKETRGIETKHFDSQSNINFQNCFIDFDPSLDSEELNFNSSGLIFGRETCINGFGTDPGFVSIIEGSGNYHLRSEAMGFLINSVCISRAVDGGDIGCYDELRERLDVEVPKKLKSYFALIGEGIHYPIILNSEKITFTLEFKPSKSFALPAVLFDTRSHPDDKDYILVVYNNNKGDYITDIEQAPDSAITDPYTFKIIVVNEESRYVVLSPIEMYSDSDYQIWNKLSFTVNYEKTFNEKANFDEKDKYQNIITMFHNGELAVESFLKNDMNYDQHNELLEGDNDNGSNAWNYNNISRFITIGSTFDNDPDNQGGVDYTLNGYYSELRIDNKFINRKELEAWNNKIVPFNDPITYIDQDNLARTFDPTIVNDLWTLKTKYDVGAKGHKFNKHTHKRFTYDGGEFAWALTQATTNYLANGDLVQPFFASITTDAPVGEDSENLTTIVFDHVVTIQTVGDGTNDTATGIVIDFGNRGGVPFNSYEELDQFIQDEIDGPSNGPTKIRVDRLPDNKFHIHTLNYSASGIKIIFENGGDAEEFGFAVPTPVDAPYTVTDDIPSAGNKTVEAGKNTDSVEVIAGATFEMSAEHDVWTEYNPEFSRLSPVSLGVSRIITINNDEEADDPTGDKYIKIITHRGTNRTIAIGEDYTYSVYMYRRENEFSLDDIKVLMIEDYEEEELEFDKIDNIYGYWWLASKTFQYTVADDPVNPGDNSDIGIIVKGEVDIFIDAFQLEEGAIATPFVLNTDPNEGMIELDKALFNKERGVVFFRFKPLFKYNYSEPKILLEALAGEVDETTSIEGVDRTKGFKIWYEYDEEIQRGKIQFRTSLIEDSTDPDVRPDESAWECLVLEQFWDEWHTIVVSYDFDTKRFTYFFDYFKNTVDVSVIQYEFFTNLTIGRNTVWGEDVNGQPTFDPNLGPTPSSADILVKDVLITNYTTSDTELTNWINANEFYKEAVFNALLDSYQIEMYKAIEQLDGLTHDTYNIEQNINNILADINALKANTDLAIDLTELRVDCDRLLNEIYNPVTGLIARADGVDTLNINQEDRINDNRIDIDEHTTLIQVNNNLIGAEEVDRIAAFDNLIARLASPNSPSLGDGASIIGVQSGGPFSSTNVQAVLIELEGRVDTNEVDILAIGSSISGLENDQELMKDGGDGSTWTASHATNDGWNIAQLRTDVNSNDTDIQTNVNAITLEITNRGLADTALDTALRLYTDGEIADLAGVGRTVETIKANWDLIQTNITDIGNITTASGLITTEVNLVKDGVDGLTWDSTMNLKSHEDRLDAIDLLTPGIQTNTDALVLLTPRVTNLETDLGQEITDRGNADTLIINNLASTSNTLGASLIGIEDATSSFAATDVEGALQEIDGKLQALAGSLNWQASVADVASLPTSGNGLNDARIVQDDGDGKRAQYVWNGTIWVKVSDVDWGDASGVVYDNVDSGLLATDVKSAIDELYIRSASPNNIEEDVTVGQWTADAGSYYYDVVHDLKTLNIAVRAVDSTGQEIGVDDFERLNINTVRVHIANAIDTTFIVFGADNSYSKVIGSWTPAGSMYTKDVVHGFDTQKIMTSVFNINTGERVGVDSIETLDANAIRVMTDNNSDVLNIFVLKQTSNATTKDIDYWLASGGMYECALPLAVDYDAVYSFYDPITSKTVEVDSVKFENGLIKIRRSENTVLRMVILK